MSYILYCLPYCILDNSVWMSLADDMCDKVGTV